MELEEAILNLKETIELNNRLLDPINKQSFNKKERQLIEKENTSIEIVLQALENSISKKKVEETFEYIEDYFERLNGPDEDIEYIREKKKELLEGK